MKNLPAIILLLTVVILTGCKKETASEACFRTSDIQYTIFDEIAFENCSEEAGSYHWDFGDSTTSTLADPVHQYQEHGTYTVNLTTHSVDGNIVDEAYKVLTIVEPIRGLWTIESIKNVCFVDDTIFSAKVFPVDSLDYLEIYADSTFHMKKFGQFQSGMWIYRGYEVDLEDTTYTVLNMAANSFQLIRFLEDTACTGKLEHIINLERATL